MRLLIPAFLLVACSEAGPDPIPSSDAINPPRMTYDCAPTGHVVMIYITGEGERLEPLPTGEYCDYEAHHPKPRR